VTTRSFAEDECLTFRADELVIDADDETFVLGGSVEARCGRYELRSERLGVRRTAEGAHVDGPASIVLCPCARMPIELDFDQAELCDSGDAYVEDPTLRVGSVPVFWLPWVWLRAPDRPGLLPPKVAWRGQGGLLLGPGARLPWAESDGSPAWMDVYLSGYHRGGAEATASVVTPSSESSLVFDRMQGDLVRFRSQGTTRAGEHGGLSVSADVARGSRVPSGLVELRDAAVVYDRADAFVQMRPMPGVFLDSGVAMVGQRGAGALAFGPALLLDGGGPLGKHLAWEAGLGLRALAQDQATTQLASSRLRLLAGTVWGPVRLSADGQASGHTYTSPHRAWSDLAAWTTTEAAAPLRRRYGAWTHRVEPFVGALWLEAHRKGAAQLPIRPGALRSGHRYRVSGGMRNGLGPTGRPHGGELALDLARIGQVSRSKSTHAATARFVVRTGALHLHADASGVRGDEGDGGVVVGGLSAGGARTVGASAEVASRTELDTLDARALQPMGAGWVPGATLSEPGTSLSAGGHVPLMSGLQAAAASDWDLGRRRWLGTGGGLVFEHPCGCAQGRAWVSRRIGRPGTDAWLSVQIR